MDAAFPDTKGLEKGGYSELNELGWNLRALEGRLPSSPSSEAGDRVSQASLEGERKRNE